MPEPADVSWWSACTRKYNRAPINTAPSPQTVPTNVALSAMRSPAPPITLRGVAHERCLAKDLSRIAPSGREKLSKVATHTQYFAVALPRTIEVRLQAASQTSEAKNKWTPT